MVYNGNDLIELGFAPGPHFQEMLKVANSLADHDLSHSVILEQLQEIYDEAEINQVKDYIPLRDHVEIDMFVETESNYEKENVSAALESMKLVSKTPTVINSAIMPDVCPAGPLGTIPVGGVVATKNAIHPGMHSADICCSMYLTSFSKNRSTSDVLNSVQKRSHFGIGGRDKPVVTQSLDPIIERAQDNMYLKDKKVIKAMRHHLGTQGDGNHFFFVGKKASNDEMTFITHHGSRQPGAMLYKLGMKQAEKFRQELSPDTLKQNAWIPFDEPEGKEYWEALQIIRDWTKLNHEIIHYFVAADLQMLPRDITDHFWNEHNFVFKKDDTFYHAKGSTPVGFEYDRTIIPMNMGEPILITEKGSNSWGFAPHGAGRNMSRTKYIASKKGQSVEDIIKEEVPHIEARFFEGKPDISELPGAYKNARGVERQINKFELANIIDRVLPLGSMMAGEIEKPWLKGRKK